MKKELTIRRLIGVLYVHYCNNSRYFSREIMSRRPRKQERIRISQLQKAKFLANIDPSDPAVSPPVGSVNADPGELAHNNTYGALPRFYIDQVVVCRTCGTEEVWPAERQKWWYEVAKGDINTKAVYCRACREKEKARKSKARRVHLEGLEKKRIEK